MLWWGLWMGFTVEPFPFGLLTLIVSLEAILLSGLILSSQNRQGLEDTTLIKKDLKVSKATNESIDDLMVKVEELKDMLQKWAVVQKND